MKTYARIMWLGISMAITGPALTLADHLRLHWACGILLAVIAIQWVGLIYFLFQVTHRDSK